MTDPNRWYFSKEKIQNTPSRRNGLDEDKEISYRQHAANFIQDMGQRLQVTQLCINTAIVYMHRFYMFHSFTKFHRNAIAACALFLAAKVEEQPRKLEHVIKVAHWCLNIKPKDRQGTQLDVKSPEYIKQANELVINENIMLQTLGFEIGIEHPHTSVVKCCQLVKASKDLAQTSYFMATSSLHLTTMCLQYKPTIVACFCIYMACKWSNFEIPVSNEGKEWFRYVDDTVTLEMLESLTSEFLFVFEKLSGRQNKKKSELRNSFDHRSMLPIASTSGAGNNTKKQPPSASGLPNDPDSKQRPPTCKPNDPQSTSSINNKFMPSQSSVSSLSHNHLPNNVPPPLGNGPIKEPLKKPPTIDQPDRPLHKPDVNSVNMSKQYDNKSKLGSEPYYYVFNRDKKPQPPQQQQQQQPPPPPSIKQERDAFSKQHQQPAIPSASALKFENKPPAPGHLSASLSKEMTSKDGKYGYSNSEPNDKNNNSKGTANDLDGKARALSAAGSLKTVDQKPPMSKQQQIQLEKQRQQDERNRLRPKNQDYLWGDSNKPISKPNNSNNNNNNNNSSNQSSLSSSAFINNNSSSTNSSSTVNHAFFENLINNSSIYPNSNSNSSNDNNSLTKSPVKVNWDLFGGGNSSSNEGSFDPKRDLKDLNSDMGIKMEFSDNDSNQSEVNLNSLPFMSDTINGQMDTSSSSSKPVAPVSTSSTAAKNSFMAIFKSDTTDANKQTTKSPASSNFNLRNSLGNNNNSALRSSLPTNSLNNLSSLPSASLSQSLIPPPPPVNSQLSLNSSTTAAISSVLSSSSLTPIASNNPAPPQHPKQAPPPPPPPANNQSNLIHSGVHQPSSLPTHLTSSQSFPLQPAHNPAGSFGSSLSLLNFNPNQAALNPTAKPTDQLAMPNNLYPNNFSNLSSSTTASSLANHSSPFHMPAVPGQSSVSLEQSGLLANDSSSYHKSSSKEKKSKDKDRSEKHHKKHKSKDKHHKKHKERSKDKDRSSKHHSSGADDMVGPSPIKLIIKKDRNEKERSDDNSNGEKPVLKIVIPKPPTYSSSGGGSDRKRRQSSSREREHSKMAKLEK